MPDPAAGEDLRVRLRQARLMVLFEPARLGDPDEALGRLAAAWPSIDVVQVRCKAEGRTAGPSPAAPLFEWTRAVLDLAAALGGDTPLVVVNDRPDVALALREAGVAGVHLGQDDQPPSSARAFLGPKLLLGLSTHDARQVARAVAEPVDYLGFGPVWPTSTKGYARGLGPERALAAHHASPLPVFPIGGVDLERAVELLEIGRAAVSSAVLEASDPARAARELRDLLASGADDELF